MNPDLAARLLREELEDALVDPGDGSAEAVALSVLPPVDLAPDSCFQIRASLGPRTVVSDLPSGLAIAYLADEEAAVDEWKSWVAGLRQSLLYGNSVIHD
jgi:hypothetical protein